MPDIHRGIIQLKKSIVPLILLYYIFVNVSIATRQKKSEYDYAFKEREKLGAEREKNA